MRKMRGYSLIELLAVLAILGVLAGMVMPLAEINAERSRERALKRALWEIRDAIDAYRLAQLSGAIQPRAGVDPSVPYPPDLDTLTRLIPDQRVEHSGEYLRFLRSVPRDPFADPLLPAAQTWKTRSYFDNEGSSSATTQVRDAVPDIYDVHSRATGLALDGTALNQW